MLRYCEAGNPTLESKIESWTLFPSLFPATVPWKAAEDWPVAWDLAPHVGDREKAAGV